MPEKKGPGRRFSPKGFDAQGRAALIRRMRENQELLYTGGIWIATLLLVFQVLVLVLEMRNDEDSIFKDVKSQYTIEDKQYGTLITTYYHDNVDIRGEKDYDLDSLSVARYADGAFRLKVYKKMQDEERQAQMRRHMQEARNHMGIYMNHTTLIKDELDLIE